MVVESSVIEGQKIVHIWTLKTMYDNDSIAMRDDKGKSFRFKISELMKVLNFLKFKPVKKRVHTYLIILNCTRCGSLNVEPIYDQEEDKWDTECQDCGNITHED